jgi:NAD(P)-dependent dehydrogenase (short-subunit alcohol dehydrogenase family)
MPTVLVTGAGRGIGLALAEALIARGDRVIATVRDPFRLPETLKSAPKERIAVVGMEVTDDRSVARAAASVDEPIDAAFMARVAPPRSTPTSPRWRRCSPSTRSPRCASPAPSSRI